ncbi:unnamed protein product, partial [Owenia fusiformis]
LSSAEIKDKIISISKHITARNDNDDLSKFEDEHLKNDDNHSKNDDNHLKYDDTLSEDDDNHSKYDHDHSKDIAHHKCDIPHPASNKANSKTENKKGDFNQTIFSMTITENGIEFFSDMKSEQFELKETIKEVTSYRKSSIVETKNLSDEEERRRKYIESNEGWVPYRKKKTTINSELPKHLTCKYCGKYANDTLAPKLNHAQHKRKTMYDLAMHNNGYEKGNPHRDENTPWNHPKNTPENTPWNHPKNTPENIPWNHHSHRPYQNNCDNKCREFRNRQPLQRHSLNIPNQTWLKWEEMKGR